MDNSKGATRPRGLRWIYFLVVALLASVMIPAVAAAGGKHENGDELNQQTRLATQATNVPLLNWNGGETRLQKCFALPWGADEVDEVFRASAYYTGAGFAGSFNALLSGHFVVENWTGTGLGPVATNNNSRIAAEIDIIPVGLVSDATQQSAERLGELIEIRSYLCFSADYTSQKPGLAVIKGTFSGPAFEWAIEFGFLPLVDVDLALAINSPIDQHQWLAGWMELTDPVLVNEPADSPNPDAITKDKYPKGEIPNMAGKAGHDLRVRVKGLLPLGGKKGKFDKPYAVLPDDYADLAELYAVASWDVWNDRSPLAWDVHDDNAGSAYDNPADHIAFEHAPNLVPGCISGPFPACGTDGNVVTFAGIEAVDNVLGSRGFSRLLPSAFGLGFNPLTTLFTFGPYDELRPLDTYLPDGKIDAGDAMMPAARVDAYIHPASKDKPIGGAGYLSEVKKTDVYSVDWDGDGRTDGPHEEYAPFYETRIPATSRGPISSGTTGVEDPNNFVGFLTYGFYQYWDFADKVWTDRTKSTCVRDYGHKDKNGMDYSELDVNNNKPSYRPNLRPNPYGKQKVALYTDEHGEAWFHWNPGHGFNYDAIPGVFTDTNGACDLQGKPVLGQSDIQVEAKYPYQPVIGEQSKKSDVIKKTILNGFNKALYYEAKLPNSGVDGWHVTAWYTEIDGNGPGRKTHERVCFATSANGLINVTPELAGKMTRVEGYKGWTCVRMKSEKRDRPEPPTRAESRKHHHHNRGPALAQITVRSTDGQPVTVFADFTDERIKRSIVLGEKSGGTPPPVPGDKAVGTAPKGAGTAAPTAAQFKAAGVAVPQVATRALKVKKAKFKKVKANGKIKRGIVFGKFVSPTKKVKAKVQLMGFKRGQLTVLKTFKVTKKANTKKMIRIKVIKNTKLVKRVKSVRVTPIKAVGKPIAA